MQGAVPLNAGQWMAILHVDDQGWATCRDPATDAAGRCPVAFLDLENPRICGRELYGLNPAKPGESEELKAARCKIIDIIQNHIARMDRAQQLLAQVAFQQFKIKLR